VSLSSEVAEPARVTAALNHAVRADHLKALLGSYEVDLVIDVGAHHGQFATSGPESWAPDARRRASEARRIRA
jgi:hypothetical protein